MKEDRTPPRDAAPAGPTSSGDPAARSGRDRNMRSAAALRANLARRKTQARARAEAETPSPSPTATSAKGRPS